MLFGWALVAPAQAGEERPLTVVRVAAADPAGLRQFIVASVGGCAARKNIPVPALPVWLTDDYLARFEVHRQEELFAGRQWALYDTERTIYADATQACQLAVLSRRRAVREVDCRDRVTANNPPLGALADPDGYSGSLVQHTEAPAHQGCATGRARFSVEGLPTTSVKGVRCVWRGDALAQKWQALAAKLGRPAAGGPSGTPGGVDACLFADLPEYVIDAGSRPVVVQQRMQPLQSLTGQALPGPAQAMTLERLTPGEAIPAERFSAGALHQFVSQPVKTPLGG